MKLTIEPQMTQNDIAYVKLHFGPEVEQEQMDRVLSMCRGYGLSCGYGPGRYSHGVQAAKKLARRLRRLGWSVSINA